MIESIHPLLFATVFPIACACAAYLNWIKKND